MKNDRGVISLEAVLVIPFFLTLIVGLLLLIRIALVQIALQNATDEAVKQMAVIMYPLEPAIQQAVTKKEEWVNSLLSWTPDPMKEMVEALLNDELSDSISQPILRELIKPIYWHYMDRSYKEGLIRYDQLHIERVVIPFLNHEDNMLGIEVSYNFRLTLPFYQKIIKIHKRAYERVWFGA